MSEMTDHEILLEVHSDMKDVLEAITTFRKTLYGNGEDGLIGKHNLLKQRVDTAGKIIVVIGGTLVSIVIVYFFNLLVK